MHEYHSPVLLGPLLIHQQNTFFSYHFYVSTLVSLCPALTLGPILVHQQKTFFSYHFYVSTLASLCPAIRAFGTDGEKELYKAFKLQLPNTIHLCCFGPFRANVTEKLTKLCIFSRRRETESVNLQLRHQRQAGLHLVANSSEEEPRKAVG